MRTSRAMSRPCRPTKSRPTLPLFGGVFGDGTLLWRLLRMVKPDHVYPALSFSALVIGALAPSSTPASSATPAMPEDDTTAVVPSFRRASASADTGLQAASAARTADSTAGRSASGISLGAIHGWKSSGLTSVAPI